MKKIIYSTYFIQEKNQILLGLKKRGFAVGKWDGFGGKISESESITEGAIRELKEEANIIPINGELRAILIQYLNDIELQIHIFKAYDYEGEIQESEEMKPQWFDLQQIPFKQMWIDNEIWYDKMLNDQCFKGEFWYDGEDVLIKSNISDMNYDDLKQYQQNYIQHKL